MIEILQTNIFDKAKIISGVTKKNYNNFNPFGFTISQSSIASRDLVENNRKLLSNELGIERENLVFQKQTHSDIIQIITAENKAEINESDGLITQEKGLILNISIADCAGILIYDIDKQAIAAVHSGWRGTKQKIAQKTINIMSEKYNTNPKDLLVYVSPCASVERYEVGEDFTDFFPNSTHLAQDGKYYFDNKSEIKSQLLSLGVLEKNIEISSICTIEDGRFHSYRRDKGNSGRMSAFVGMKL